MNEIKKAGFQLDRFIISKCSFEDLEKYTDTIDIKLEPSGVYNTSNGEFQITLDFSAESKEIDKQPIRPIASVTLKGFYTISDKPEFENIPDFFYQNSIAILFPYLRSFISNMTLQAGSTLLVLPLLNLTNLSTVLKENTVIFK